METITIPIQEYIDLLEDKLHVLKEAFKQDSSWNYPIDETELKIKELKAKLS